jgi:pimeloyl-ACP methyl ester carboxylesterase
VVLIEPVLFSWGLMTAWNTARRLGLQDRVHPLIPSARRRKRAFPGTGEMFTRYRRASIFRRMDDAALHAYVTAMARPRADGQPGVELAYSADWEVRIYETGPLDLRDRIGALKLPLLAIRGAETDTFRPAAVRMLKQRLPQATVRDVPQSGHLVPLEKPGEVAGMIEEFVEGLEIRN